MKVSELIELLQAVNQDYEVKLDLPGMTLADSFVSDVTHKCIYLETIKDD